jgi:two-component system, OmpR family, sensor histidine kinase KdpD
MSKDTPARRGRLRIYFGYAAGVGKTYQMLERAQEVARQGIDIVIGYLEPHGRPDTVAKAEGLPVVPRTAMIYRGATFEEMDLKAVVARRPAVALVDELPHTNVPGSRHDKRWEDVLELLDAGIDVWTTMNVQHLESLNDQVAAITGVPVRETVPDWVIAEAHEVVMVDLTPHALLNRLRRGVVYQPAEANRALEHFFKESTLVALRELALRQAAHEVELRRVTSALGQSLPTGQGTAGERLLLHVTDAPSTVFVIRRGRRIADYLHADSFAVYVQPGRDLAELREDRRTRIERHLDFARQLHIETHVLRGREVASTLVEFARLHEVTQILLLRPPPARWLLFPMRTLAYRLVRLARDIQVVVIAPRL